MKLGAWLIGLSVVIAGSASLAEEEDAWGDDLRFSRRMQQNFFIKFAARGGASPAKSFQINTQARKGRRKSMFVKMNEQFADGAFRLVGYQEKVGRSRTGIDTDMSELTILHLKTEKKFVLVLGLEKPWPTFFGEFYLQSDPKNVFYVREAETGEIAGKGQFELLEVTEQSAKIKIPSSGKVCTLAATPRES